MKKIMKLLLIAVIIIGVSALASFYMYKSTINEPLSSKDETVIIEANKGTFSGVMLENEQMFKKPIFIKIYNKLNDVSISVKKGVYEFPSDIKLDELLDALESGKYNTSVVRVTIPEGYTVEQIAETLESKGILSEDNFINGVKDYTTPDYVKDDKSKRYKLEGYLFPDTYMLENGMTAKEIIDIMIGRFEEVISEIENENSLTLDKSKMEWYVTKASIIEREVSKADEKALVSSVIDNRLDIDMKLQIDATVLYALGKHKEKVYLKDLKVKSPYNTYYTTGLPVGPISNPGKDSLEAAINPVESDYIYYMTKDGTNHKFFKEYKEFLKYKNS